MSRLSLLVGVALLSGAGVAGGAVVFDPPPVPSGECSKHYPRLNARYQRQLDVLNMYSSRMWVQAPASAYGYQRPVIDLLQQPCEQKNLHWRKGDLMPERVEYRAVSPTAAGGKGSILIIPKTLMDRPVRSFERADVARQLSRAE